jgi:hypothetical protein
MRISRIAALEPQDKNRENMKLTSRPRKTDKTTPTVDTPVVGPETDRDGGAGLAAQ